MHNCAEDCIPGMVTSPPRSGCSILHNGLSDQQPCKKTMTSSKEGKKLLSLDINNTVSGGENNAIVNQGSPALVDLQRTGVLNLNLALRIQEVKYIIRTGRSSED